MQVIHYLNYTAQVFNSSADVITTVSTESASTLRAMCSARMLHVSKLWSIANQKKNDEFPTWNFSQFPFALASESDVADAVSVLESVKESELMLLASKFSMTYNTQENIFNGVFDHSKTCFNLLVRIIDRLDADSTADIWICQNCLCSQDKRNDECWCCGMKENWLKPLNRF